MGNRPPWVGGHASGTCRPQEIINKDVRECHLFIGLLHARWGTPTGAYSSGFEEEYRLACDLRKQDGAVPDICLFFKKVPEAQMKDPGDQLKLVLQFREDVQRKREVLFKDIDSSTD